MNGLQGRRGTRSLLAVLAATVLLTTTAGVAAAETVRVFDKVGDGVSGYGPSSRLADIQRFRVDHNYRKIRFRLWNAKRGRLAHFGDFTDVWVDTNPGNPGPERLITFSLETEGFSVSRVDRFFDTNNPNAGATGRQVCGNRGYVGRRYRYIGMRIPRACFGYAQRVRVAVQTAHEGFERRRDWAPGFRRFSRWVGRA